MIDVGQFVRHNLIKPKVLHSIPGRLRISVPGVKKATPLLLETLEDLDLYDVGIKSVKSSAYTGNTLINYDAQKISDKEILEAIRTLALTFLTYRERFIKLFKENNLDKNEKIKQYLMSSDELFKGKEMELPDDLW